LVAILTSKLSYKNSTINRYSWTVNMSPEGEKTNTVNNKINKLLAVYRDCPLQMQQHITTYE
jgi:hypothetical protein